MGGGALLGLYPSEHANSDNFDNINNSCEQSTNIYSLTNSSFVDISSNQATNQISFDNLNQIEIVFPSAKNSTTLMSNAEHTDKMVATKKNDTIEMQVIKDNGEYVIESSIDAEFSMHQDITNGDSLYYKNGSFYSSNSSHISYMATSSKEAKILKLASGNIKFKNATFVGDFTGRAFLLEGGKLTLENVTIDSYGSPHGVPIGDMDEPDSGGAIKAICADIVLDDCVLKNNHATLDSGAIYCYEVGLAISNTQFQDNSTNGYSEFAPLEYQDIRLADSIINITGEIASEIIVFIPEITSIDEVVADTSYIAYVETQKDAKGNIDKARTQTYINQALEKIEVSFVNNSYYQTEIYTPTTQSENSYISYLACGYRYYTATFLNTDGSVFSQIPAKYKSTITNAPTNVTAKWSIFKAWSEDGVTALSSIVMPAKDTTYFPLFDKKVAILNKSWNSSSLISISTTDEYTYLNLSFTDVAPQGTTCISSNLATSDSDYPIYLYSDGTNGYFVSEAQIHFPADSSGLFENDINIIHTSIDTTNANLSLVQDINTCFMGVDDATPVDFIINNPEKNNITNMSGLFYYAHSPQSITIHKLYTSEVTNMKNMFALCDYLIILDLSCFDTNNVIYMSGMFDNCTRLETLDISSFVINSGTDVSYMFFGCFSLGTLYAPQTIASDISIELPCIMYYYDDNGEQQSTQYLKTAQQGKVLYSSSSSVSTSALNIETNLSTNPKQINNYVSILTLANEQEEQSDKLSIVAVDDKFRKLQENTSAIVDFDGIDLNKLE